MVALRSKDADKFIAACQGGVSVWLVHGVDDGLVDERIRAILAKVVDNPLDPLQVIRLPGSSSDQRQFELAEEWNSIGLFNARRAIRIDLGSQDILEELQVCLDNPSPDCVLVIKAGQLRRDAPIRMLCERHRLAAVTECETDGPVEIQSFIEAELAAHRIAIGRDALAHLVSCLGMDRKISRTELDKLITFVGEGNKVEQSDIDDVITDAAPHAEDLSLISSLRGDSSAAMQVLSRGALDASDYSGLLGLSLRICLLLHRATTEIESGISRNQAVERAQRMAGSMKRFLPDLLPRRNSDSDLAAIQALREGVGASRRTPALTEMITVRNLWAIAYRSRSNRST